MASKFDGLLPPWPDYDGSEKGDERLLDPDIWTFIQECWDPRPLLRPTATMLVAKAKDVCDSYSSLHPEM